MNFALARDISWDHVTYPVFVQEKLDGVRAQLRDGVLYSRDEIPFPAVSLPRFSCVLDGELYRDGWPRQRIIGAVTCVEPSADTFEIKFRVFDLVLNEPQYERLAALDTMIFPHNIEVLPSFLYYDRKDIENFYDSVVKLGGEGIVLRDYAAAYCPGRSWAIQRWKAYDVEDFLCIGVAEGKGKRVGMLGAFTLTDGKVTFKCGGGNMTDEQLTDFWLNPPLNRKLTIKYYGRSSGNIPLTCQFIGLA